jgi:hypothetical protein
MTDDAARIFKAFREEMKEAKKAAEAEGEGLDPLYVRHDENAMKFALIRACGEVSKPAEASIDASIAEWAVEVVRCCTRHMERIARDHIHNSEFSRHLNVFRTLIEAAGPRGLTEKELGRRKETQVPKREYEEVLGRLITQERIKLVNTNAGKVKSNGVKVKSRNAYIATAFLELGDDDVEE